jgi:hypothetical protein
MNGISDSLKLCGRKPVFGDREQIKAIKEAKKARRKKKRFSVKVEYVITTSKKTVVDVVAANEEEAEEKATNEIIKVEKKAGNKEVDVVELKATFVEIEGKPKRDRLTIDWVKERHGED